MNQSIAFLSFNAGRYRVIHKGLAVSADKQTPAEALDAARKKGLEIDDAAWNIDRQEWVWLSTIEELYE